MKNFKIDFPIFQHHPELVYLDSAATSQKPQVVIGAVKNVYEYTNANIHRGMYDLSQDATELFENSREKVVRFIGADSCSEIIFTSGTTESINLVAYGWAKKYLKAGDVIVLSETEHHSNIVPWLRLRDEIGVELVFLKVKDNFQLEYKTSFTKNIKLVVLTHVSNVLGTVNPIADIVSYFKKQNSEIKVLIDAAQSVSHFPVDVKKLDCDFLAFSSHKMMGSSGVGVLWAKKELLNEMNPLLVGSHMIKRVTKHHVTWADVPEKFEPGTRNIEGVIGLGAAIDYLQHIGFENIQRHERELLSYALEMFSNQKEVTLFGSTDVKERVGVFSFAIGDIHPHDVAEILNRKHIAVRAGHHCAQPLMERLGVAGTVRASISVYNTREDIDALSEGITLVKKKFKRE